MINITITIIAPMANPFGKNDFSFEIADGATIEDLLSKLGYSDINVKHIMPIVNNTLRRHNYQLQDNDKVILSVPMGGG